MADDDVVQLISSLDVSIVKLTKKLQTALGETDSFTKNNESKHKASLERVERMYEQLDLSNKLQVASTAGDQARVKALQEELELSKQIQRYRSAGLNTSDATAAAKAHMSALAVAEEAATGGLNRAQMMELTHVAKSLFDQLAAGQSPMRALQVEGGRIAQVFAEGEGGVGGTFKALTGLMTPLNLGLLAGVSALALLAVAAGKAHEAAEEVVQLKISADKFGIPVEQLQLWQFIAAQSHVTNQQLDQSFQALTVTLGKLKSGIREQRIQPFVEELGISDADIAKANTAADLMQLLITKMEKIKDPGERMQIAQAFGLEAAIPLIQRTGAEVRAMTDDFARNADIISGKQADALDGQEQKLTRAHELMQGKIRGDLVQLAPLIGNVAIAWDTVAEAALNAAVNMAKAGGTKPPAPNGVVGAAEGFVHLVGKTALPQPIGAIMDFVMNTANRAATGQAFAPHASQAIPKGSATGGDGAARMAEAKKATEDLSKAMAEYVTHTSHAAEMTKRIAADRASGAKISPQQEAALMSAARAQDAKYGEGQAKKAASAANKAEEALKASDDAIDTAKKDELKARIALTGDLIQEHTLKLQELADDRARKDRQADQDARLGKISAPAAATIKQANGTAYDEGVALENRKFNETIADQARTYGDELRRYQLAHLTAMAQLATSTQDWAADTRQAFALQQQTSRADFMAEINKRLTEAGEKHLTAEQAQAEIAAFDAQQADELSASNRSVDQEVAQKKREFADQLAGYVTSTLEAEAAMADTAVQRRALEKRILDMRQQQAREELERQIKAPGFQGDADAARSGLADAQSAERAQFDDQHLSPWDAWVKEGQKASADVGSALQSGAVQGMDRLNSGIAEAVANGKNMGDVFRSIFRQMESDALQYLLRQAEIGVFGPGGLNLGGMLSGGLGALGGAPSAAAAPAFNPISLLSMGLPMFAGGTDDAPGGPTIYNEQGTEGYVPPGAQIIPNSTLKGLAKISDAVASGGLGGAPTTLNHTLKIDLTGANGDETIRRISYEAAATGFAHAVAVSRGDQARNVKAQRNSTSGF